MTDSTDKTEKVLLNERGRVMKTVKDIYRRFHYAESLTDRARSALKVAADKQDTEYFIRVAEVWIRKSRNFIRGLEPNYGTLEEEIGSIEKVLQVQYQGAQKDLAEEDEIFARHLESTRSVIRDSLSSIEIIVRTLNEAETQLSSKIGLGGMLANLDDTFHNAHDKLSYNHRLVREAMAKALVFYKGQVRTYEHEKKEEASVDYSKVAIRIVSNVWELRVLGLTDAGFGQKMVYEDLKGKGFSRPPTLPRGYSDWLKFSPVMLLSRKGTMRDKSVAYILEIIAPMQHDGFNIKTNRSEGRFAYMQIETIVPESVYNHVSANNFTKLEEMLASVLPKPIYEFLVNTAIRHSKNYQNNPLNIFESPRKYLELG
tara:strand:+ start:2378 stop:3490 length:1113 start_codon:yes stop_codon:yes gene_type:complete